MLLAGGPQRVPSRGRQAPWGVGVSGEELFGQSGEKVGLGLVMVVGEGLGMGCWQRVF